MAGQEIKLIGDHVPSQMMHDGHVNRGNIGPTVSAAIVDEILTRGLHPLGTSLSFFAFPRHPRPGATDFSRLSG